MNRNYSFPAKCQTNTFRFGHPTIESLNTVKDLLQTGFTLKEDPAVQTMYMRSHGNYQPAEQKCRDYNWPFNPSKHVFGKADKLVQKEAQQCLQPEKKEPDTFPTTQLIKKNIEDFRDFNKDHLGRPKNLGQTKHLINKDIVFGRNPKKGDEWHAKECLTGEASFKECYEDGQLGKATRYGFRNRVLPGDDHRVFGVPSIRDDIPKPKQLGVANRFNYGNEPTAVELLFPHGYTHYGLDDNEVCIKRNREEIKSIFKNIGVEYKPGKFEGIWLRSCEIEGSHDDTAVSVKSFLHAVKEMDHLN